MNWIGKLIAKRLSENAIVTGDLGPEKFEKGKECSTLSKNILITEKA